VRITGFCITEPGDNIVAKLSVNLDDGERDALKSLAKRMGVDMSELVRLGIRVILERDGDVEQSPAAPASKSVLQPVRKPPLGTNAAGSRSEMATRLNATHADKAQDPEMEAALEQRRQITRKALGFE
jgi:hypothetical protein